MSTRLLVSAPLGNGRDVVLEGDAAHYLGRVLRAAVGDTIIVFNGDYQYDPRKLPTLQQIEPSQLNKLQAFSLMVELSSHTLPASVMNVVANLDRMNAAELDNVSGLTQAQLQPEIPALHELIVGKVYRGQDNTLLVVIPPSIVLNR